MEYKVLPFWTKALDEDTGIIEGYAAIMGNRDSGGDRIFNGAFTKTIAENGSRVKVRWMHQEPMGRTLGIKEVGRDELPPEVLALAPDATGGLWVQGKITPTTVNKDRLLLMKDGVVDGLSIGYGVVIEEHPIPNDWRTRDLKELKLHEWSPVDLAMNEAAIITGAKGKDGEPMDEDKRAVPPHTTAKADEGTRWDGPAERGAAEVADLKIMAAIILRDGETKADYKLHHHLHGEGHPVVWKGVAAAGAIIMGGRGGVNAPESDILGAKRHLARHYEQFDRDPPWEKGFSPAGLKDYGVADRPALAKALVDRLLDQVVSDGDAMVEETKEGRVLSARNRGKVQAALTALQALLSATGADSDGNRGKRLALAQHEDTQGRARAFLATVPS